MDESSIMVWHVGWVRMPLRVGITKGERDNRLHDGITHNYTRHVGYRVYGVSRLESRGLMSALGQKQRVGAYLVAGYRKGYLLYCFRSQAEHFGDFHFTHIHHSLWQPSDA